MGVLFIVKNSVCFFYDILNLPRRLVTYFTLLSTYIIMKSM